MDKELGVIAKNENYEKSSFNIIYKELSRTSMISMLILLHHTSLLHLLFCQSVVLASSVCEISVAAPDHGAAGAGVGGVHHVGLVWRGLVPLVRHPGAPAVPRPVLGRPA